MNQIRFGAEGPHSVFRPMIDFYELGGGEAAWTLVALCDGMHDRVLMTGTAGLPLELSGHELRCSFVDAPNPVVLEGEAGALKVRSSTLRIAGLEPGFVSVVGAVECEWAASVTGARRSFVIELRAVAAFRI